MSNKITYLELNKSNYAIKECYESEFEDLLYETVGYNFGSRHSKDGNYIIYEDNTLEGELSTILKESFFGRQVYGTVIIVARDFKDGKINLKDIL